MGYRIERGLSAAAVVVVLYAMLVLGYVATSPDIGLRCLLIDDIPEANGVHRGVIIKALPAGNQIYGEHPELGDLLVRINESQIRTFVDFTTQVAALRSAPLKAGSGPYPINFDPQELKGSQLTGSQMLPPLVYDLASRRFVEVEYIDLTPDGDSPAAGKSGEELIPQHKTCFLAVGSLPAEGVALTLLWFFLQLGIFVVSALVYWHRPNDRPSRLFFTLCMVTLGAFIGTSHWWIIAASFWLAAPCVICAMLLPVVALHFFLVFPKPWPALLKYPVASMFALYAIPVLATAGMLSLLGWCAWLNSNEYTSIDIEQTRLALQWIRYGVYAYLMIASIYFVGAFFVLHRSVGAAQNFLEYSQLRLLRWAGIISVICMAWTLYLAAFRPTEFALGDWGARLAIFLAALVFTLAYTVGIVRYRLMLVDQIVSKGALYYVFSSVLTAVVSLAMVGSMLLPRYLNISLGNQQAISITLVLMLVVAILIWMRDMFQRAIDRRFFREKYQLDKALQRMNRAVEHLVNPESLAEMMLSSCRDVLNVDRAALYLRNSTDGPFHLVATLGAENIPIQFSPVPDFLETLHQAGSLQRVTAVSRSEMTPVQNVLRELRADLVHALEMGNGIVGLVLLSGRKNAVGFSAEDLTFLNALGQITNVALRSAKLEARLNDELRHKMERVAAQQRQIAALQAELSSSQGDAVVRGNLADFRRGEIKGASPAIEKVLETVKKVATSEATVLIRGESGTGKELLAQVLHDNSPRSAGPMIRVHCAALSPGLLESELFGHVKGAFTGAHRDKVGRFEAANGGTLFLDEIGDISLETQVKLLRVLQERCFEPVGGSKTVHVDVRLITATHQNLEKLIAAGRFREDLYYRLNVITLNLPGLRERRDDILELAVHFLSRGAKKLGRRMKHFDDEALAILEQYNWPGNIRELENVVERAVVLSEGDRITARDLPAEITRASARLPRQVIETKPARITSVTQNEPEPVDARAFVEDEPSSDEIPTEKEALLDALNQCHGNKARAARLLGMPRSTYFSKLKKYAIE